MSATAAAAIEMAKHFTAAPFAEFDPAGSFAKLNGKPIAAVKAGAIDPLMSKARRAGRRSKQGVIGGLDPAIHEAAPQAQP